MTRAASLLRSIRETELVERSGRILQFFGTALESEGPDVRLGEQCRIRTGDDGSETLAEVVGFREGRVLLLPYGEIDGIRLGSEVVATGRDLDIPVGEAMIGRVIDAFGHPLDSGPPIAVDTHVPLRPAARNPLARPPITEPLETGVSVIDALHAVGRGQRVGLFSGSGVGKSTLLGMIARHAAADVSVVAMIGERGREVREFVEDVLGKDGLARSVVVVATADQPALLRTRAALAATSVAEAFRDSGRRVVLTMDSLTRDAMAQREIGLAAGEPPTARGYTPSVFSLLPRLLERSGTAEGGGSITAFYSVLTEGDDLNDPIADSVRAILDGHVVLSRDLHNQGRYPAIDPLLSHSRLRRKVLSDADRATADRALALLSTYEQSRDLVEIGAYRPGSNRDLDLAIKLRSEIASLFTQDARESRPAAESRSALARVIAKAGGGRA